MIGKISVLAAVLLIPTQALSAPKLLNGEAIADLLPKIIALGEQTRQTFSAAGATTYTDRGACKVINIVRNGRQLMVGLAMVSNMTPAPRGWSGSMAAVIARSIR